MMDYDFESKYQHYSTTELLAILQEPHRYQEAAIVAAKKILMQRDPEEVDAEWKRMSAAVPAYVPEPMSTLQEADTLSIFDDEPAYNVQHVRLLRNLVVGVYGFHVLMAIISLVSLYQLQVLQEIDTISSILLVVVGFATLYLVSMILLLQQRRAGWHLAMAVAVMDLVSFFGSVVMGFINRGSGMFTPGFFSIINLFLTIGVVIVLRRHDVRTHYRISFEVMIRTIVIGAVVGALYFTIQNTLLY